MARLQLALTVRTSNPVPAGQPNLASRKLVWTQVNRNIFLRSPGRPAPISGPIDFPRKSLFFSTFLYFCPSLSTFCPMVYSACLAASLPFAHCCLPDSAVFRCPAAPARNAGLAPGLNNSSPRLSRQPVCAILTSRFLTLYQCYIDSSVPRGTCTAFYIWHY